MADPTAIAVLAAKIIREAEGCVLTAYADPKKGWAVPTIGYGCTGPDIVRGTVWTLEKAEAELARRLAGEFVPALLGALGKPLPDAACAAIVCMLWNIGAGAVKAPQFAAALRVGDPMGVAAQFPKWDKITINGVATSDPDMLRRRLREQKLFLAAVRAGPAPGGA